MKAIEVYNPACPSERVWSGSETTPEQLTRVLAAAKSAQREWAALSGRQRHDTLEKFFLAIEQRTNALVECMVREQGKLQAEATGEVGKSLVEARWMLGRCLEQAGTVMASARAEVRSIAMKRPRGVVLAITPWNFPVLTPMRKIVPALVFGNAIILKPSSDAPGSAMLLQEAADEILPAGLLNVILGGSELAGKAMRADEIAAITFTGSTNVGRKIMAVAAEGLKEVSLELGGKNPAIVHDNRHLESAVDHIVRAAFANGGQRCTAISRVLVNSAIRNEFLVNAKARIEILKPGPGTDSASTLSPLSTKSQYEKVCDFVDGLDGRSTNILCGGAAADIPGGGFFYQPTLVEVIEPSADINFTEIFGPVLGVEFYDDIDDAIARANAPEYGLTASIFATDFAAVRKFEEGIEAGMLHINHGTFPDENMPFGGWKSSGVGAPSVGEQADQFFTRTQSVYEAV